MRILVTGGGGFIGRQVMRVLADRGHDAVSFDLAAGQDIRDAAAVSAAVAGRDHVIHLAGVLGTAELFDTPALAVDANVHGTLHVLQACDRHGAGYTGITMPESPWRNLYAATKGAAVHLAEAWRREYGIRVSHVRAFNAYGPGQAHGPGHPRKIIPTFAVAALSGQPVQIWGSGRQTVDLVHAEDLARMLADATGYGDGEVLDGGTGFPVTVREVADLVLDAAGGGTVEYLLMRPGETEDTHIAAGGAGWDLLGWHPEWRPGAVAETVDWYRSAVPDLQKVS